MDVSHFVWTNVVKVFSRNRINSLAERQAFAHCCELLQVWRKCFLYQSRKAKVYGKMLIFIIFIRCKYKYPIWALNRIKMKIRSITQKKTRNQNKNTKLENCQEPYMVVPYYQGLIESVKRTCNKHGVQVYFKAGVTIKSLLMAPKDQDPMLKRSGVINKYT